MRSTRLPWDQPDNALSAIARAVRGRRQILDLTESNPTQVGLPYPARALATALARVDVADYAPAPLGLPSARAAVAADYGRAGVVVDPERIVLTASSSESYGFLLKLACDPGDAVLIPEPSYPLCEYLARLEGVVPFGYRLAFDGIWHIDFASVEEALAAARLEGHRPRAIVVINPNNPTGSFVKREELGRLATLCGEAALTVISDEVFGPYAVGPDPDRVATLALEPLLATAAPAFSLGGLSKSCGLPQLKLGWIVVGGRDASRSLTALELIADTYLSVATPVQAALGDLLALGAELRAAIAARVARNRATLAAALPPSSACTLLPSEGGWSAVLRVPALRTDEAWAATLLTEDGVLTQPGYFFDLRGGTFLVLGLIPRPEIFATAVARLVARVDALR